MKRCPKLTNKQRDELQNIIRDSRYSSKETRRAQAVLMVNEEAHDKTITRLTGYNREYAFWVRKRYLQQGITAIEDKKNKNPKELLTKREREEILQTIKTKTPE